MTFEGIRTVSRVAVAGGIVVERKSTAGRVLGAGAIAKECADTVSRVVIRIVVLKCALAVGCVVVAGCIAS